MRAYYVGDVEKRLDKLGIQQRRRVLGHARLEAHRTASSLDLQPELFAVLPCHLDECGFKTRKRPLSPRKLMEEAFVAYASEFGLEPNWPRQNAGWRRQQLRKLIKMDGTDVHRAFQHFANGWSAGRASR